MLRSIPVWLVLALSATGCANTGSEAEPRPAAREHASAQLIPGQLLVRFIDGLEPRQVDRILEREGATLVAHLESIGIHHVRVQTPDTAAEAERWTALPEVEYAEPNRHRPRP